MIVTVGNIRFDAGAVKVSPEKAQWLKRYWCLAQHVSFWSKDPSTKVGAVLIGHHQRHIALGYNGFPPGIDDTEERLNDRPTKYLLTQHAERNVLDNANFVCSDATLVTTMFPCAECAKSIISKGITTVVAPPPPQPFEDQPSWRDHTHWSTRMFEEAGVSFIRVLDRDFLEED